VVKIDTVMSCTGCAVKWTQIGENRYSNELYRVCSEVDTEW